MIEFKKGNYYKINNRQIILIIEVLEKVVELRFIAGNTIFSKEKAHTIHKVELLCRRVEELSPLEMELL
jgi:hypothetical protein